MIHFIHPYTNPLLIGKDLFNIVNSIKLSNYRNDFQQKFDVDIAELKQSKDVLVFADKTGNIYKMLPEQHKRFWEEM